MNGEWSIVRATLITHHLNLNFAVTVSPALYNRIFPTPIPPVGILKMGSAINENLFVNFRSAIAERFTLENK